MQFGGVNIREVPNNRDGTFDISELKTRIRTYDIHEPITKLICVENTHNILGGKALPVDWIDEVGWFIYIYILHNIQWISGIHMV